MKCKYIYYCNAKISDIITEIKEDTKYLVSHTATGGFSSMNDVIGVTASISTKLTCSSGRTVSPERQRLTSASSFSTFKTYVELESYNTYMYNNFLIKQY